MLITVQILIMNNLELTNVDIHNIRTKKNNLSLFSTDLKCFVFVFDYKKRNGKRILIVFWCQSVDDLLSICALTTVRIFSQDKKKSHLGRREWVLSL